ncbi:M42 family peptidase [Romboutsia weinsteinii]|uniref:M42 family peptidase n=1 Tax=Romboutsia weinsteinii TaxID=2020949 RepID=A0A371J356_9FIRM|nr:M42 family metallopeptidase [Romboutsia weinsteinii]RDY27114.1 M42 family peptidase [Romboutsia weinsteinii]
MSDKSREYEEVDITLLKELSEADGISGAEKEVSRVAKNYFEMYADEIDYDNLGSIIGLKRGNKNGPKVMIAGHMDEIGFVVRSIDKNGYINLLPVGGWWGHVMPSQSMRITTNSGSKIKGVVGSRAPHGMPADEKERVIKPIDFYLDLGVDSKDEVEKLGIKIGDMITPDTEFEIMNNPNYLLGKAWDDRIGVAVAIDVLKELKDINHEANIFSVGTVQEEVGIRGARTATHKIKPDIAFAIDVTTAKDTPMDKGGLKLGCGVVVSILDASTIGNNALIREIENICNEAGLDINYDCMVAGGTDAGNIHKTLDGVISMTLSIPTRYMHSNRLIIHKKDYVQTVKVISEFCKRVDMNILEDLKNNIR